MKKILFIRGTKSYLPEIAAYKDYFTKTNQFICEECEFIHEKVLSDYDILWEFMGLSKVKPLEKQLYIHEYASLSTGKFARIKNYIKRIVNRKCDLRIFTNEVVRDGIGYKDKTPYCLRDQGIDGESLKNQTNKNKEFDFVYIGYISKEREIDKFLDYYVKNFNSKLLLIGSYESEIYDKFKNYDFLTFTGKIESKKVPELASKAIYGLNLIPNRYPFNLQTSTKLLEYIGLGLKIISTNYYWINWFEKQYECKFFKFNHINELNIQKIYSFEFKNPKNISQFLWNKRIEDSKLLETINLILHEKKGEV